MYRGLIAAAGLSTRLQDLGENRNKALADLGGESILSTILANFEQSGVAEVIVVAGFDAHAVRLACAERARCLLNPFYVHRRIDVDFPCDLNKARQLYAANRPASRLTA
jgi:choline kinase